jgi:hypothetical protein
MVRNFSLRLSTNDNYKLRFGRIRTTSILLYIKEK